MRKLLYISVTCLICTFLASLTACRSTKPIIVHETKDSLIHDTFYNKVYSIDTVIRWDSIVIDRKGDTVLIDRWHNEREYKADIDTLIITKNVTVTKVKPEPYEVIKEVQYVPKFIKFLAWVGGISLLMLLGFTIYRLLKVFK